MKVFHPKFTRAKLGTRATYLPSQTYYIIITYDFMSYDSIQLSKHEYCYTESQLEINATVAIHMTNSPLDFNVLIQ